MLIFRRPADWNCFFDACYSDYKNFVDAISGNACTTIGFTFTNADFDTNLQNIVDCSLLGSSQQVLRYLGGLLTYIFLGYSLKSIKKEVLLIQSVSREMSLKT